MGIKRVLIISPYFPPSNAADMHRVRMSLPYFSGLGWEAEVVTVGPQYSDLKKDELLNESIPEGTTIHQVKAFPKSVTAKFGLGSIALRSLWFYRQKVNSLLKQKKYDLIYFSTTQFPVCVLGAYWKKRFGVPYLIDMQDPWHSEYYQHKPKNQRPSKYWFSYRLNKWLEPMAMKGVSGLISVSQSYIDDLKNRYPFIKDIPSTVITFGAFEKDFEIAEKNADKLNPYVKPEAGRINMVYVGRGGHDMQSSVKLLFKAVLKGLSVQPALFKKFHLYFIGTSYAAAGKGLKTFQSVAEQLGLKDCVTENPDRIGFYDFIATLQNADILFIPGSDDPKYTASKLYPYLMSQKALLNIFHEKSNAVNILRSCSPDATVFTFPASEEELISNIYRKMFEWASGPIGASVLNLPAFEEYSALVMTTKQTHLFNQVTS